MSKIEKNIIDAIQKSVRGVFPDCPEEILASVYLEIPKEKRFGDFSTNVAMRLAREMKKPPMDIAASVAGKAKEALASDDAVSDIKIEKPGFINFYLSNKAVIEALSKILREGSRFGRSSLEKGKKVQIEFVSANPTGPLTVAHGRQAAVGDSLARILEFCGHRVTREYYINDEGVQMDILGRSVRARYLEAMGEKSEFPENGYKGSYIHDIAQAVKGEAKQKGPLTDEFFAEYASKRIMRMIKQDLKDFGVAFDVWYSQKKLSGSGKIKKALSVLKAGGFLYEKAGATWFRSTEFGDDKDRVVIKKDGVFTYLAPDIAYHKEKFEKGYERVINIWGPDHHGYVCRLRAACQAFGFAKDALSILIAQLVTLYRDKKPIKMSTREGEFITLRQVIDEVGRDAGRFFFMMRRTDSHLDFDLELAKARTMDNPVYYIQYAHARISSIISFSGNAAPALKGLHVLDKPEEVNIIKTLMQYPKIVQGSAHNLEPYLLLAYLQDLARLFHSYYDSYRVVTDDSAVTKARIALIKAIKTVLSSGLTLLGVSAPEKM
ncbi:MAG: arginine--tRNA ligase [Candidatus Omnitrophica bacterium]|nr:arginine--tRNA ligase [Candidatus Omnitrophota bacterium]